MLTAFGLDSAIELISGAILLCLEVVCPDRVLSGDRCLWELIEFCAERLARYKCPTSVSFVDQIPQGLVGKVLRRELRGAPGDGQA